MTIESDFMICLKCKNKVDSDLNICDKCGYYLHRETLKEIVWIIRKYGKSGNYRHIKSLLENARKITAGTKYEKFIEWQLAETEIKLNQIHREFDDLKQQAKEYIKKSDYRNGIETLRKLLEFPLTRKERIAVENELLKIKAQIYNYEMQVTLKKNEPIFMFKF